MKEINVFANWIGLPDSKKMGILRSEIVKGHEVFSFDYDSAWLKSGYAQELDPDLKLFTGPQYVHDEKPNFGLFLDSSPDRWGRMLMERREAIISRNTQQARKRLTESDFLLGVADVSRMGALRFKLNESADFLAAQHDIGIPPFTSIRALEQASLRVEEDNFIHDEDAQKWLTMLLVPGSSLGGARPKASVLDAEGQLWIAKFPSRNDNKDSGAWELLVNSLAYELGINVAVCTAGIYGQKQHTFLTKRFDRTTDQKRIHFASALSLLGYKDGYSHKDGGSYLEIVELIERFGSQTNADIRELWKRIVFSVAISNTDDHLRNHGFLLTKNGWKLSPAYDINPVEKASGLSLNISENDNSLDFDLCLSVIDYFRWQPEEAKAFIHQTKKTVSQWKKRASSLNISPTEQFMMETAFIK
jgi:serine/threonine-protein kinase HipA